MVELIGLGRLSPLAFRNAAECRIICCVGSSVLVFHVGLVFQWVWWSGFPSSLGLVVSLSSLKPRNWWRLEMPECVSQKLTSAWLWVVCVCVHVCIRMGSRRKNRRRRMLSRSHSKNELICNELSKWCRICKWPQASFYSYAAYDFPRGS